MRTAAPEQPDTSSSKRYALDGYRIKLGPAFVGELLTRDRGAFEEMVRRVNAHDDLLEMARLFERVIEFEIKRSTKAGDDEGARLKTGTLNMVREAIAKAEGR